MGGDRSECTCANIDEQCVVQVLSRVTTITIIDMKVYAFIT